MSTWDDAKLVKEMASFAVNTPGGFSNFSEEEQAAYDEAVERIGDENLCIVEFQQIDGMAVPIIGPWTPDLLEE